MQNCVSPSLTTLITGNEEEFNFGLRVGNNTHEKKQVSLSYSVCSFHGITPLQLMKLYQKFLPSSALGIIEWNGLEETSKII